MWPIVCFPSLTITHRSMLKNTLLNSTNTFARHTLRPISLRSFTIMSTSSAAEMINKKSGMLDLAKEIKIVHLFFSRTLPMQLS